MKFSSSIEYAIHSLIYISRNGGAAPVLVADVARAINVSETYLRKVFQQLVRTGLLMSQRGVNGGFFFSRPASEITLKDVVEAVDGSLPSYICMRKQKRCSISLDCPVKREFARAQARMAEVLDATSIKELDVEIAESIEAPNWIRVHA